MKSISRNKIVRTIRKYKAKDGKPNSYEIEFMTFSKYDAKSEYKFIDGNIALYPYKWYDIRCFYEIPNYRLLLFMNKLRIIKKLKTENNTSFKKSLIEKIISHPLALLIIGILSAAVMNSDRIMKFINEKVNGI
jgi:hypothetical protein